MLNIVAIAGLVAALLPGPATASPSGTDPDVPEPPVMVDVVSIIGSGCLAKTVAINISPDNTSFVLSYSAYKAQVGVGARPTDFRKDCTLAIQVHNPSGFTSAISEVRYQGYAHLESGAAARLRTNNYIQGESPTRGFTHPLGGPLDGTWQVTETADPEELVYVPCGEDRYHYLNTALMVSAGSSDTKTTTSHMVLESMSDFRLAWKRCA